MYRKKKSILKRYLCFQTIDNIIEQVENYSTELQISASSLHKNLYTTVECNEKGYFELFLESGGERGTGRVYSICTFIEHLLAIKYKYGNINVYVNHGKTSLKEKFDTTGNRYVYLTNHYNDSGYL